MYTYSEFKEDFAECQRELESLGYNPYDRAYTLEINNRAATMFGRCSNKLTNNSTKIEIMSKPCDYRTREENRNTVMHELIHSLPNCSGHKGEWAKVANRVNSRLGYNITRCSPAPENAPIREKQNNYVVICEKCGNKIYRQKMSKALQNIEHYRCCHCGGMLKVEKV